MARYDSQKLGSKALKGWQKSTTTNAVLKPAVIPPGRPRATVSIITAAMINARWAGKAKPANAAYKAAANRAGSKAKRVAACCSGNNSKHQRLIAQASPATKLTCRPEIESKCAVPLVRYCCHCASLKPRRSATTKAGTNACATGQGAKMCRNLALIASRHLPKLSLGIVCSFTATNVPRRQNVPQPGANCFTPLAQT